jgi:hypothetical protein
MNAIFYAVLALIFLGLGYACSEFELVDACLDAGGAWSDARNVCVGIEPRHFSGSQ